MGRFRFELANRSDDAELRTILAATPMAGHVSVSFRREPSFFEAAVVEGDFHQVVVCRDQQQHRIAGFGSRSVRTLLVDGKPMPVGYLSGLRALPEYRNRGLLARGYAYLKQLHDDGRAPFYLTTIADGNDQALQTLTTARAGLPFYNYVGKFHTLVIPVTRRRGRLLRTKEISSVQVRSATLDDQCAVLRFLHTVGRERQFFPCYGEKDFFTGEGALRGLALDDLLLAFRDGALVGTFGCWNQFPYRQSVVHSYSASLRWSRPLYNGWARVRGLSKLPSPGTPFRYVTGALPVVHANDPHVFRALLQQALLRTAAGGCDYLLLGLHEADPLLPLAQAFQSGSFQTRIYLVCWEKKELLGVALHDRPIYLELGCL